MAKTDIERELALDVIQEAELAKIHTFEDLLAYASRTNAPSESISDYGDGFTVVENKETLVGSPFIIIDWKFRNGDHGEYASARLMTHDGRKLVLNDGSSGIMRQLQSVTAHRLGDAGRNAQEWLACERGLRASRYVYLDSDGKEKPAVTYYLA